MRFPDERKQWQAGFTLVEILVVMLILGILLALGGGSYRTSQIKARDSQRKSDLKQIGIALEAYYNDHKQYPDSHATNHTIMGCGGMPGVPDDEIECGWGSALQDGNNTIYMVELPADPLSNLTYYYDSNGTYYKLYARLENDRDMDIPTGGDYGISCGTANCNYGWSSPNTTL